MVTPQVWTHDRVVAMAIPGCHDLKLRPRSLSIDCSKPSSNSTGLPEATGVPERIVAEPDCEALCASLGFEHEVLRIREGLESAVQLLDPKLVSPELNPNGELGTTTSKLVDVVGLITGLRLLITGLFFISQNRELEGPNWLKRRIHWHRFIDEAEGTCRGCRRHHHRGRCALRPLSSFIEGQTSQTIQDVESLWFSLPKLHQGRLHRFGASLYQ